MSAVVDLVTIAALFVGPSLAVGLSLVIEQRRKDREAKMGVMRSLMLTRVNAADPNFQAAITLVPIVFHNEEAVLNKWDEYMEAVNQKYTNDAASQSTIMTNNNRAHDLLCEALLISLGYKIRDTTRMVRTRYFTESYTNQQKMTASTLGAIIKVGEATERMASANEKLLARLDQHK